MINEVIREISRQHHYNNISGKYWSRVGSLVKRYGGETVLQAVKQLPEKEIPLMDLLCMIEKRCQYIIEHGEIDDLARDIFGL